MAAITDDRWVWLGLGVLLFVAAKGISHGLQAIVHLSEIHDPLFDKHPPTESSIEASISPSTLKTLTESPNPDLSQATVSVLLNRFASTPTDLENWSTDLFSPSRSTRKHAWRLSNLFTNYALRDTVEQPEILRLKGLIARSIDSNSSGARTFRAAYHAAKRRKERGHQDAWNALRRLSTILERDYAQIAVLVVEPEMGERQVVHWARAQRRLLDALDPERDVLYQEAVKAMLAAADDELPEAGDESVEEDDDDEGEDGEDTVYRRDVLNTLSALEAAYSRHAETLGGGGQVGGRTARFHEESPEEIEVRRRRREAMLFHEGEGRLGIEDIIQPRR